MAKKTKVPDIIRAMSKEEVTRLWLKLKELSSEAERYADDCLTSDKQGIRFLARQDFEYYSHKHRIMEEARNWLIYCLDGPVKLPKEKK